MVSCLLFRVCMLVLDLILSVLFVCAEVSRRFLCLSRGCVCVCKRQVFALLVLARFIEAFWSSRELAPQIKYSVGAACWALLALYLLFAGRRQGGRHGPE